LAEAAVDMQVFLVDQVFLADQAAVLDISVLAVQECLVKEIAEEQDLLAVVIGAEEAVVPEEAAVRILAEQLPVQEVPV
jgi:hypothetical protein